MQISAKAFQFIVAQEDGSETYYDRTESHFDWPGGSSGPTVGVGYDLGYVTVNECVNDWTGIVTPDTINKMIEGCGMTANRAHIFVQNMRTEVSITWAQAMQEFSDREIPKWEHRMELALPNWGLLSPDCKGALLSLGYNRGTAGFLSNLPRFREMYQIREAMGAGKLPLIPGLIRAMVRIWPSSSDLRRRRVLEAQLFAEGLAQGLDRTALDKTKPATSSPQPAAPAAPAAPTPAPAKQEAAPVGDTIGEIQEVVNEVERFLPTITGILGAFVPGTGPLLTMASPFLAIANEILSAIETLKGTGMSHQAAAAVVGTAVTHIGQTISAAVPAAAVAAAVAAAPRGGPAPGSQTQMPSQIPIPHESH